MYHVCKYTCLVVSWSIRVLKSLGSFEKLSFLSNHFWKIKILSFWSQIKNTKIWEGHFLERLILHLLAFPDCCYLKTEHSSSLETFAFFTQKWRSMTSLKHHFLKIAYFCENLVKDVKLMLGKVLRVSCWYLPPFLSCWENPTRRGGGQNLLSPLLAGAV